ncbi:hypothetical protein SDC9_117880 [bioreactor metagenome]|uniref:Uncharacterized protein n=1 Tax=bioreactor metagenome TaxID=1076179 RepID=A0A645BZZ4_9ZZZZ
MVSANIVGIAQILRVAHPVQPRQNLAALDGMGLHHLKLLRRQAAGLVQNRVGNGNFSDVVQGGGAGNHIDGMFIHSVFGMLLRHLPQQNTGKAANAANVLSGLQTPVLDDGGKSVDQRGVGLPDAGSLLRHQLFQMELVTVKLHGVLYPPFHRTGLKRLYNDIRGPQIKYPNLAFGGVVGGDDDDGDTGKVFIPRRFLQHRVSVLYRHQ